MTKIPETPSAGETAPQAPRRLAALAHALAHFLDSLRAAALELSQLLVIALAMALLVRVFVFQPYDIPSGSMEGTLRIGDYVFVEKFAYGYSRFSLPFGHLLPSFGRVFAAEPKRGDVVVFALPSAPRTDFIKRVIGLPGDRVQMIDGVLYLNDQPVPKTPVAAFIETWPDGSVHRVAQYRETLPGGKSYLVLDRSADGPEDTTEAFTVPPGHYFMLGDNRDDSDDSRGIVGYVPSENLIGKAQFTILSVDDEKSSWWKFWAWPRVFRAGRFFARID
jgi:signal peptidase I